MRFYLPTGTTRDQFAARYFKLAYDASRVVGMGFLQCRDTTTETDVFTQAHDDGISLHIDYGFGKMMKCEIEYLSTGAICVSERENNPEYQSYTRKYPTNADLARAAADSLGIQLKIEPPATA